MKVDRKQVTAMLEKLGTQVKAIRKEQKLTQREFYELSKIHIARIELGKVNISLSTLVAICSLLRIKVWELLKAVDL